MRHHFYHLLSRRFQKASGTFEPALFQHRPAKQSFAILTQVVIMEDKRQELQYLLNQLSEHQIRYLLAFIKKRFKL